MLDKQIIKKAKKGNEKAFLKLIDNEKSRLYRMAYLYVKNENDAIDIVQETIYKAFISLKTLKKENYFSTWLTRILINNALDFIKKNKRMIPVNDIEKHQNAKAQSVEERIDMIDAVERLGEPYKTVIILRYYNDFTLKQIAEVLKCPEGTIKSNLHRAVAKLKTNLREEFIK